MMTHLRYAFRMLTKSPAFTVIAVLTLALGIGANSAIFSVVDAVLLRPLPFPKPTELIAVWSTASGSSERQADSFPDYADIRDQSQTIESLTCYTLTSGFLGQGEQARELQGLAVTSDIFRVLQVQPFLGRGFSREEDSVDARVIVLGYETWQHDFNGDPNIVGRQISFALRPYTILGVMPRGFRYPVGGKCEYLMPLHPLVPAEINNRGSHFLRLIGRLKPGVPVKQASAEATAIAAQLEKQYPDTNTGRSNYAVSLRNDLVGDVQRPLIIVLAAVFVVLLIACANVANLLLARATARRREIAIRTALGASRVSIISQLLAEGFLLALAGGLAGLLLAWWGIDLLRWLGPNDVPRIDEVSINGGVIIFTLAAAVFSTLLFALVPALQISRPNVNESLQEGNRGAVGPESHRLRALLVISQVALSMLLLAGAGLLIKSFSNLRLTDPGFDAARVVTADVVLPRAKYSEPSKYQPFYDQLLVKLKTLPGAETVGGVTPLPFSGNDRGTSFWIEGRPDPGLGNHPDASHLTIIGDYFRAMHIPLLSGRTFENRDTADGIRVVMINEAFTRKFFPSENPIGRHLIIDRAQGKRDVVEIVGIVGSTRHESMAIAPIPEFYMPGAQDPSRRMDLVLRTSLAKLSGLDSALRKHLNEMDHDVFVPKFESLQSHIDTSLAQPRFHTMLLGIFAAIAMILAAIGIYGVIAYGVAQRTKEIGIRMALGAQRTDMLRMILRQSLTIVGIGLGVGLISALVVTRLMVTLLYGVSANDFSIYGIVLILLATAALLASYFPARRAMKVDPLVALRYE